ncbi:MAG TPA: NAD(P)/FAD-dependent oxidoreductase [Nocardioidaceae bacterium]|nr:NAD(P)/FAD-dependent oxidoreductase [Nocardioidaceae bacterium]
MSTAIDHEVVVIGAGFGGIGAAIELQRKGIHDFVVVEKWGDVGGTWHANTYPGVAVDIPGLIYSFSYEQKGDWSRAFAPGEELQRYAKHMVDKYSLGEKLRLNTTIVHSEFDEDDNVWHLRTDAGNTITARFVVAAIGGLERPKLPEIEGLDSFEGTLLHTALWDNDVELAGKRVAVIGTGATALQLVPAIADEVEHLEVYQRTPIWVAPKTDPVYGPLARMVFGIAPVRNTIRAIGTFATEIGMGGMVYGPGWVSDVQRRAIEFGLRRWMRTQVDDPEIREKLIPQYGFMCKRPSISNTYLKTFNRPQVSLVTDPIERVTSTGIVTAGGVEHEVDVLICATGFKLWDAGAIPPYPVIGRGGKDLGEFWGKERFQAYQGVSVPDYPNMFLVTGPYGFVLGSYIWMIEATTAHISRAIAETKRRGETSCEIKPEVHQAYWEKCLERQQRNFLFTPTCAGSNTYYLDQHGDSPFRPSTHGEMWWHNRHFDLDVYRYDSVTGQPVKKSLRTPARKPARKPARNAAAS